MPQSAVCSFDPEKRRFHLLAGAAGGRDETHALIRRWPGWRREPLPARLGGPGGPLCSRYSAPAWTSAVLPLIGTRSLLISWEPQATVARDDVLQGFTGARDALSRPEVKSSALFTLPSKREPMPHQWQAIRALRHLTWRALLADDMGLGKTSTALWALWDCGASRCVIVCPVSVKFNWAREAKLTLADSWADCPIHVIDGTRDQRANTFADFQANMTLQIATHSAVPIMVILNYDLLIHLTEDQRKWLGFFGSGDGSFLICDESHYLKNKNAERTKLVTEMFAGEDGAQYRLCLTGTPIRNLPDDLYSQAQIIRPGTWTSHHDFCNRHLVMQMVKFGKKRSPVVRKAKDLKGLNAVVQTFQIRRKKEDVLDLPEKTRTFPELTLDQDTRKIYDEMKRFARVKLSELEPGLNVFDPRARSGVEAAMRCEQIAQGFVGGIPEPVMQAVTDKVMKKAVKIPGRPHELLFPSSAKIVWLLEAMEAIKVQGGRPVVFSRFNAPLFWLHQTFVDTVDVIPFLHGGLDAKEKDEAIRSFQEHGEMLLCQVRIAEGFNLVQSQDALFLGRDWSPAINRQAEDRLHRIGQKGTVNIQVPIVRDTVEVMIHKKLAAKAADAQQALRETTVEELMEAL